MYHYTSVSFVCVYHWHKSRWKNASWLPFFRQSIFSLAHACTLATSQRVRVIRVECAARIKPLLNSHLTCESIVYHATTCSPASESLRKWICTGLRCPFFSLESEVARKERLWKRKDKFLHDSRALRAEASSTLNFEHPYRFYDSFWLKLQVGKQEIDVSTARAFLCMFWERRPAQVAEVLCACTCLLPLLCSHVAFLNSLSLV